MKTLFALAVILGGGLLAGCAGESTTATQTEEQSFRNPPANPPAGAAEGMRRGMESAAQATQKSGG